MDFRHMDYNYAAMALSLLIFIYFRTSYRIDNACKKMLNMIFASIFLVAAGDCFIEFGYRFNDFLPELLLHLFTEVYLVLILLPPYLLTRYAESLVERDGGKRKQIHTYINRVFYLGYVLFSVLTLPKHILLWRDSEGIVQRGNGYIVIFLLSAYYLFYSVLLLCVKLTVLNRKQTISVFCFAACTGVSATMQYFVFRDEILIYFIYALSSMILLFRFETPDYEKLVAATKELKESEQELKLARKREEQLAGTVHQLLRTASWAIYFDEQGQVKEAEWSPEFLQLMGYDKESYPGDPTYLWQELLHPDDKERVLKAFFEGLQGKPYREECRMSTREGQYFWYLCSGELKRNADGSLNSYQGFIQNIEDEKIKDELIEEKQKALAELEQSQGELRNALFAAEEANRAKTIFLSNMSHDIRTPMNAVVGFTQLALEHLDDREELVEYLHTIRSSSNHLLSLINDILDMSRIESGKVQVNVAPTDLQEDMKSIGAFMNPGIIEKNHVFKMSFEGLSHPYVLCDRLRLNQILINVIGNAIKYTKEGGCIEFSVIERSNEKPNEKSEQLIYVFRVRDNGIGMSQEFVQKIFEPFERDTSAEHTGIQGTGLGMAITKNLVEMMGGTIRVESELGVGSCFIIELPLTLISKDDIVSEDYSEKLVSEEEMCRILSTKRFLVVDDNGINRKLLVKLLSERGISIEECASGQEAIARIEDVEKGRFDLIFMDIQMPGMNGYQATDILRASKDQQIAELPILAMTANAFEEDKHEARSHGMNGHIEKPFKIHDLIKTVYQYWA